ncbi:MAG: hypothetical protein GXP37_11145 [Chloroflexi bacterium]|nr:hypothetical protein [Chloroflexota bacterium]
MNKLTFNFLGLLVLATLSMGMVWSRLSAIVSGQASASSLAIAVVSTLLLVITLSLLARITLFSAKQRAIVLAASPEEDNHV